VRLFQRGTKRAGVEVIEIDNTGVDCQFNPRLGKNGLIWGTSIETHFD
jgi:hypothetical protein